MSTRILPALVLACLFAPACDPIPEPDLDEGNALDGDAGCKEEATVLAGLDAATALGFTAADVLASAGGTHMSPMTWSKGLNDAPAIVEFGPEAGAAQLTVAINYAGGEIRHIKSTPEGFENGNDGGFVAECHDRLEIDVEVDLDSSGGALAEHFVAPLRATTRGIATLRHSIEFDAVQGSLALTKVEPADAEVGPVDLDIGISPSGLFGSASALVEIAVAGGVGATFMDLARWPAAASACETGFGEAPVALADEIAGFSAADALALVAAAGDLSLTWQGAQPTAMTLELAHDGAPVCAVYEGESIGALRFAVDAKVKTADDRWDGNFPVEVSARPAADGTLAAVSVYVPAAYANSVAAADFAAFFGLAGIDLTGYDEGALDFSGEFTPAAPASGKVDVLGVKHHMCSNEPGAPCEGNTYVTLDSAAWSSL
jgi:hypothetical protein